jgi:hypothetical protein
MLNTPKGFNVDELLVRAIMNEREADKRSDSWTQKPRTFPHTSHKEGKIIPVTGREGP